VPVEILVAWLDHRIGHVEVQMSDVLGDDLRKQLARRQVVVVIGAGVSVGATGEVPTASWLGLLHDGAARCEAVVGHGLPAGWGDRVRAQIDSGDMEEMLSAAENITRRLGGPNGGEYGRWLRDSVGSLRATNPEVIQALADLGAPIATTNYDSLIEQVTGLPAVTWRQGALVERVVRRDDSGVVHLHGHWQDPASVVLGIHSYEAVLSSEHAQAVQRALAMVQSLLFVGFGAGLADPNFGVLRAWLGRVLLGSQYRHFRLGRNGELAALQAEHGLAERIMVVGYGLDHADLGPFLRTLSLAEPAPADRDTDAARSNVPAAGVLPPPPRCFGRDPIIDDLVQTVCAKQSPPTPVLGPPGIGKSTVCLAALHHRRVAARFRERRWFVRCNAATTGAGLLADVATAVGVAPGPDRVAETLTALAAEPGVLVLDNVETPWEADTEGTERVLAQLAGIAELRLLVTMRGAQRPFGVPWRESVLLPPLGVADGRRVFLAVAGQRFADDPYLDELVVAQDGVPLAIELLAYLAEAEPDLAALWRRWRAKRVALRRGGGGSPQLSAEVSFELSITGPRMTEPARRLLSLLGVLPDGVAHQDLDVLLPGEGEEAAWSLRRVGLAFDEGSRLRSLQPIRDHVQHHHPPGHDDLRRTARHYRTLAANLGPSVGGIGGATASARLAAEPGNLEVMLHHELSSDDPIPAVECILGLTDFLRMSGFGSIQLLEAALRASERADDRYLQAYALFSLGVVASTRSGPATATVRLEQALLLYKQIGSALGQANCLHALGNMALRRSDYDTAEASFMQAQPLFEQIGNFLGQANCMVSLGDLALQRSDYDMAEASFKQAQPLFEQVGDVLGHANCVIFLGDVAFQRSDYDTATACFEQAQPLFEQIGNIRGQANCILGLGNIALERSDYAMASACFEKAQSLFEQIGNIRGQANCIMLLGDVALERSNLAGATAHYEEALELYRPLPDPYYIGQVHRRLAHVAASFDERNRHVQAARDAWNSIGRADLIQDLDVEFGEA
jgi:tetratricopeptide (TPR) repeat protein